MQFTPSETTSNPGTSTRAAQSARVVFAEPIHFLHPRMQQMPLQRVGHGRHERRFCLDCRSRAGHRDARRANMLRLFGLRHAACGQGLEDKMEGLQLTFDSGDLNIPLFNGPCITPIHPSQLRTRALCTNPIYRGPCYSQA